MPRLLALALLLTIPLAAYEPTKENLEARQWFQDAKFGLFIHWGVYATIGKGEWVMQQQKISIPEYERYAELFNPEKFDAKAWVSMAKQAGMKYITITSKHHDGFAMWDSKLTDWDIVDRTPYGKDVLKQLADECHRQGIKLFFYHSQLDWHSLDYFPRGRTGQHSIRPDEGDFNKYLDYMDGQLTELLTNYGPIGGIWFDGMWDKPDADWRLAQTYGLIHKLQPAAMIGSNHHIAPFPGEDFQMFEKDLPGQNEAGFSEAGVVSKLPLESAQTISGAWGFNFSDHRNKSVEELLRFLVRAAGADANLLLNVGPMADGTIQPEHVERLLAMGKWLDQNGESIYGTRGGPVSPRHWGVTTQKGSRIYVHLLEPEDGVVVLPDFGKPVASAKLMHGGQAVRVEKQDFGTVLYVPKSIQDPIDTIIQIETGR
ncbi:MAG: alpha-L-fucosidase [Bryobacterales bacterium]|nr:alpha-L-fucosidase [Bryobacterales bacterium]